jgi:hypothetical protein
MADTFDELVEKTTSSQTQAVAKQRIVELLSNPAGSQSGRNKHNRSLQSTSYLVADSEADVIAARK